MITTKEITKYRSVWMGIAILWVIFFHSDLPSVTGFIGMIKKIGYGGVDIFMFASGLGCYYSYSKCEDSFIFIKRRIKRVMPVYLVFLILFFLLMLYVNVFTFGAMIGNIFCIQYFTTLPGEFNWYVAAMWFTYFITPLIYDFIKHANKSGKRIALIVVVLLMTIPFWTVDRYIIFVTRIPLFIMGMFLGSEKDDVISKRMYWLSIIAFVLGSVLLLCSYKYFDSLLWSYGLHWYPFILIVPGLCLIISSACKFLETFKAGVVVVNAFSFVGRYTFELFMMHMLLFKLVNEWDYRGYIVYSQKIWYLTMVVVIIGSFILNLLGKVVSKVIFERFL